MAKMHTILSADGSETVLVNSHSVPLKTMIAIEKKFKLKPRYETVDDNPNESYEVLELEVGNVSLTFFSKHLVKPEYDIPPEMASPETEK